MHIAGSCLAPDPPYMTTTTRINLLSTPRNVSTAFMYSFAARKDVVAVDEPFYAPWLLATGVQHPGREEILASHEQEVQKVIDQLLHKDFGSPILFVKNMCPQLVGVPWEYLNAFQNIIFIREPTRPLISFAKVLEPDAQEMGTLTQLEIFHFLQQQGQTPLVLDSGELLKNPELVLSKLCQQLHIPFDPAMLQWGSWSQTYGWGLGEILVHYRSYIHKIQDAIPKSTYSW